MERVYIEHWAHAWEVTERWDEELRQSGYPPSP